LDRTFGPVSPYGGERWERVKERPVAFRFKKASCVVAGTFNMYIVQPPWLAKIGLIPRGVEVAIGSKLDEPGFRFLSPKLRSSWYITPGRIEVETEAEDENCGEQVATVLSRLPWTPLAGIGNNFIYEAPPSEVERLPDLRQFDPVPPPEYEMHQRSYRLGVNRGERLFNLQLSVTRGLIELSINVHTELRDRESQVAQDAAREFLANRTEGQRLAQSLFKASIEHGDREHR
jgi:hypothetical protein